MRGAHLRWILVALVAIVLHLPAHFAPWSLEPHRDALPEDSPAFAGNPALAAADDEGIVAAVRRAAFDPASAWDRAAESVGATRWRPVSTALFVAEREASWKSAENGVVAGAAMVSFLLHVLAALLTMRLAAAISGDGRASLVAGLLVAASPAALPSAAWPARQAVVLATLLAVCGTLVALRGGKGRMFLGGAVLALAALAHESAFAWAAAAALLLSLGPARAAGRFAAWPCVALPAAAFVARFAVLGGLGVAAGERAANAPNVVDGLTGIVRAAVTFVAPWKFHFADGPFTFPFLAHLGAVVVLAAGGAWLVRRRRDPAAAAALAALVALSAVPLALLAGVGIAPYQDTYLYMALPLVASATAIGLAKCDGLFRGARVAGCVAAGLLIAASATATAFNAGKFRTRDRFVAFAESQMPSSIVVRSWGVASRAGGSAESVAAAAAEVRALAADAAGEEAGRLRRDTVAAAIVTRFLSDYSERVRNPAARIPISDSAFDAAEAAASAVTVLRPNSDRAWWQLAKVRWRIGAIKGARDAVERALAIAPDNVANAQLAAETALVLGDSRFAADILEKAYEQMPPNTASPEFVLLFARALAADGALRVPDPTSEHGLRYRFDIAADLLEELTHRDAEQQAPTSDGKKRLYDVYLRYGDLLASSNRTAMALISYGRAIDLTGGKPDSNAATHRKWLTDRLTEEEQAANKALLEADAMPGKPNVANALVDLYVVFCRWGSERQKDADELFDQIARDLGKIPPELRFKRAVERYAALEDPEDQKKALDELNQVIQERPALVRARYERARVLEWQGTIEGLSRAKAEYESAATEGALEDWSLDALERAEVLDEILTAGAK